MKQSDSVTNLTKPTLYSIYDKDVTNSELDYKLLKEKFTKPKREELSPHKSGKNYQKVSYVVISMAILFWMGVLFAKLSTELYDNKSLKKWMLSYTLAEFTQWAQSAIPVSPFVVYGALGVLCGISVPVMDNILLNGGKASQDLDLKSVMKCLNALLGVCLGIRTIQWSSSLQAATAWGLLNIILWLYFDGSASILIMGLVVSGLSVIITFSTLTVTNGGVPWFYLLYIVDFYFLSYLIFGKIGRYLFH
ncbi:protein Nsg2p [Monosporozyma servazzii]